MSTHSLALGFPRSRAESARASVSSGAGALDGKHAVATHTFSSHSFRDETIGGLVFEVTPKTGSLQDGVTYTVRTKEGRLLGRGESTDIENGVICCEVVARHNGHTVARHASILDTVRRLCPDSPREEQERLANKTTAFILENGRL